MATSLLLPLSDSYRPMVKGISFSKNKTESGWHINLIKEMKN
jgi:hypothetical protein